MGRRLRQPSVPNTPSRALTICGLQRSRPKWALRQSYTVRIRAAKTSFWSYGASVRQRRLSCRCSAQLAKGLLERSDRPRVERRCRFGPLFAAAIRRGRVRGMRTARCPRCPQDADEEARAHPAFRRRGRATLRFRRRHSRQTFASVDSSVHHRFDSEHSRPSHHSYKQASTAALAEWRRLGLN